MIYTVLEVFDLECIRGDRRLFAPVRFRLHAGELLHLRGDNGSGKTSLLYMLCGLLPPMGGQIHWRGQSIGKLGEDYRRELFFLGHHNAIKDELTPLENLLVSARLAEVSLDNSQAFAALEELGLAGHEDIPCHYLSQGQKRRLALARLVNEQRPLWLLDEPFVTLDSATTGRVAQLIDAHLQQGGLAIVTNHQDIELTARAVHELTLVPHSSALPC